MTRIVRSTCPHDCPSVCALDVEIDDNGRVGKVRGTKEHTYTRGVICAKVSRYNERIHHPDRLLRALVRRPGHSQASLDAFEHVPLSDAIDGVAERFDRIAQTYGPQSIWPFHYAGTMGLVQRDGLDRFRHAYGTSRQHSTFCTALSNAGWVAGAGVKRGSDVRLMRKSELVVIWGGNPVNTQVNVMHYIAEARRENNARLVVVDPYRTRTADKADLHLMLRPGTDGALACAVMHVLFAEDLVDRDYIAQYTDDADRLEHHVNSRTPAWAADITGLSVEDILQFARWYGSTRKSFLRLGYGFSRSRNGAVNMHAASCLPALTGAWREPGGGALYGNSDIYPIDSSLIEGHDIRDLHEGVRTFDQSRIGRVLCGEPSELQGGPPVAALFVQNTNPAVVAPETRRVIEGLQREDLFTVVHEQFMTETALLADVVLPATMFLEHDDLYTASGHTNLQLGPRHLEPPGATISNHDLLCALASRLGLEHRGFTLTDAEMVDETLRLSGLPDRNALLAAGGSIDLAPEFETANFLDGFGHVAVGSSVADGSRRFRFSPDWASIGPHAEGMPALPDYWDVIDNASVEFPLRLVAAPARQFLNTSFNETPGSQRMEGEPRVLVHPSDISTYGVVDGEIASLANDLGEVRLRVAADETLLAGTVIVEGLWPNAAFAGGLGINTLVSAEPGKPNGGAVFHDTAVRLSSGSLT